MAKVSIGLRGWRFDEEAVFDESGQLRPLAEMSKDVSHRVQRLTTLMNGPCDACWLIHGDDDIEKANQAAAVYGEPDSEVVLCDDHEPDFVYWYREAGGRQYRGEDELQDAFYEWFLDGGEAPDDYAGLEHVETDPADLPDPEVPDMSDRDPETPESRRERIDLRNMEVTRGADADYEKDTAASQDDHGDTPDVFLDVEGDDDH